MHISANAQKFQGADAPKVIENPERDFSTGFDYRVHIRDGKTGRLISYQPFAMHSSSGQTLLERPLGSGNAWHPNGESAGRWDFKAWKQLSDKHDEKARNPSANPAQDLHEENESLKAELAALRAEAEAKQPQHKK